MVYSVGKRRILVHSFLRILSFLPLDRSVVEGVWYLLYPGVLRGGGRGTLAILGVYLLSWLGNSLLRTGPVGGELGLRYRPSPGFHQKVRIRSLRVYVSFQVRVVIRSRIPLIPASIVLVCD